MGGLPPSMPNMGMGMPGGMPGGMPAPIFPPMGMLPLASRPPPLGRMSPERGTRSYGDRSPSPEYDRSYRSQRDSYRDPSPSSRSERRSSPHRRGPSPCRSERGYTDRRHEYSHYRDSRDRYVSNGSQGRLDRYGDRSSREERDHRLQGAASRAESLQSNSAGPKTSSPMDPQGSRNYGAV